MKNNSLILTFLIVLLLCGLMLHAAEKSRVPVVRNMDQRILNSEIKKGFEFIPNVIVLY